MRSKYTFLNDTIRLGLVVSLEGEDMTLLVAVTCALTNAFIVENLVTILLTVLCTQKGRLTSKSGGAGEPNPWNWKCRYEANIFNVN